MTVWITLMAIFISVLGIYRHLTTNLKRRHGMRQAAYEGNAYTALAWIVVIVPGLILLVIGQSAAFVMWLGALPIIGWLLSMRSPNQA